MDLSFFAHAVALSAIAVVAVHQFLKLNFVPFDFANKYPVPTNIALSILASVYAVWHDNAPQPHSWTDWVLLAATVSVSAAVTYNQLLKNWTELRQTETQGGTLNGGKQ